MPPATIPAMSPATIQAKLFATTESAGASYLNTYSQNEFCLVAHVSNSNTCHARMGHAPANVLQQLPLIYANKILDVYDSCYFAKQTRILFPFSVPRVNAFLTLFMQIFGVL